MPIDPGLAGIIGAAVGAVVGGGVALGSAWLQHEWSGKDARAQQAGVRFEPWADQWPLGTAMRLRHGLATCCPWLGCG
jgi:hypothetical protein